VDAATEAAGRAERGSGEEAETMTARLIRGGAELLIIALLVLGAVVVVVRQPGRIVTAI
jgi:hypothetical protein